MTDTETAPDLDIESLEEAETAVSTETKPQLKIESLDDLRRVMTIAQGGDPDAQQTLNNFLRFDNDTERSNLPNTTTVRCVAQLNGFSKLFYPNDDDPFALVAGCIETAFMARKGWKSNQFVEMTKQTPSLSDLQAVTEKSPSLTDRVLGRSKPE